MIEDDTCSLNHVINHLNHLTRIITSTRDDYEDKGRNHDKDKEDEDEPCHTPTFRKRPFINWDAVRASLPRHLASVER